MHERKSDYRAEERLKNPYISNLSYGVYMTVFF